ncbi:MAG: DNA-3-methyladenine glycosylase [Phycisphaerae bacterium]|nr:MAG: DNA-3-methyladenine glycosylase [Phycisphaerae bacterium]
MIARDSRLGRDFFAVSAVRLARRLLGQRLVRVLPGGQRLAGIIVETEAYVGTRDRASHAFAGRRTPRNESMFGPAGLAYVYFTYGMHHCFNVVGAREGVPEAVLVRALEPTEGLASMRRRRRLAPNAATHAVCSGPAKLCQALGIDRAQDGVDLCASTVLWIEPAPPIRRAVRTPRIGIAFAGEWAGKPLRFLVPGSFHVSPGGRRGMLPGVSPRA